MQNKKGQQLYKFQCHIISRQDSSKTQYRCYSFKTFDKDVPTTKLMDKLFGDKTKPYYYGKIDGFDLDLKNNAPYVVEAFIYASGNKDKFGIPYPPNLRVENIYPVLDAKGQDDYLKAVVSDDRYKTIKEHYPNFVDMVLKGEAIDLSVLRNIGEKTFKKMKADIESNYWKADIMGWLKPLGITDRQITRLLGKYKTPVLLRKKIKENPYVLTEIHGLGFITVDKMVMKMFPDKIVSTERVIAFIRHFLTSAAYEKGDTVITHKELDEAVSNQMPQCMDLYHDFIKNDKEVLKKIGKDVGLTYFYDIESAIYNKLLDMNKVDSFMKVDKKWINRFRTYNDFELSDEQIDAVSSLEYNNVILITGYAGTGKTSCIKAIIEAYGEYSIGLCSLSAKAAQRISEVTYKDAMTIHRTLKFNGKTFTYNKNNKLGQRMMIVDEGSMVDSLLWWNLIQALELGTKLVIVGDDAQLPPIGAGNIFADLLHSEIPVYKLTEIYRQAKMSGIITDANKVRQGINPFKDNG